MVLMAGVQLIAQLRETNQESRINDLKQQLKEAQDCSVRFRDSMAHFDSFFGEIVHGALEGIEEKITAPITRSLAQSSEKRLEAEIIRAMESIGTATQELRTIANAEHQRNAAREALAKAPPSNQSQMSQQTNAAKGAENEEDTRNLIQEAFGAQGTGFKFALKRNFSGDHVFEWNGLTLMWEDKNYARAVDQGEIDKAYRDFDANTHCDVLILASAHTAIQGYENDSNLVLEMRQDKPVIYISRLKRHPNPLEFLKCTVQPLIVGIRPFINKRPFERNEETVIVTNITTIAEEMIRTIMAQEKAIEITRAEINAKIQGVKNFYERLRVQLIQILKIGNQAEPDSRTDDDTADVIARSIQTKERRERKCGHCGNPGHDARNCPRKK